MDDGLMIPSRYAARCDWCHESYDPEDAQFTHPDTSDKFCSKKCLNDWDTETRVDLKKLGERA